MKSFRFSGRAAVVCSLILAIGVPSVAMGFGEGRSLLLGKRNPSSNPNLALNTETEIIADTTTYGTRQSNKRDGDGGGAIYGCRSNPGNEPCIRAEQPQGRPRLRVRHRSARKAGRIEVGGDHTGAPFTTNATGVATGFNADKVDGKEATDFAPATAPDLRDRLRLGSGTADRRRPADRPTADRHASRRSPTTPSTRSTSSATCPSAPTPPRPVGSASDAGPGRRRRRRASPTRSPSTSATTAPRRPAPTRGSFHVQVIC